MQAPKTIFFAGGGTGGHLYPGIAVADAIRARTPEARIVFLCTQRDIDKTILQPTGYEFIPQPIVPPVRNIGGLLKFWSSWRDTKDLVSRTLNHRQPSIVIGLGGYAAGVGVKMAAQRKIATALLNPDVIPGKANQYLMKYARVVCCQFDASAQHVASGFRDKLRTTGCPIRKDIINLPPRDVALQRLGLDPLLHTLLITGASQGAKSVNEAMIETLPKLNLQGWQVLHLAGRDHADAVRAAYRERQISANVIDFTPAMSDVWASATLAISRSGASSCAELTACGIPSILLPYPFHKDMHQRANAKVLADAGAAVLLDDFNDPRKNAEQLLPALTGLVHDSARRAEMAAKARQLGRPDAADAVASLLLGM